MTTTTLPLRCALYARVSTADQDCGLQLRELRAAVAARGWAVAGEYVEHVSAAARVRPEFEKLMAAATARPRAIDCVLVWKLDRFGRSVLNLLDNVRKLEEAGVRFVATSQGLDTDQANPTSRLLFQILAAVAEFERELIRERTRAGLKSAKAEGRVGGRPKRVFDVCTAAELLAEGHSYEMVSQVLGIPRGTLRGRLKRLP